MTDHIRPVLTRIPSHPDIQTRSNLPLGFVLTPFNDIPQRSTKSQPQPQRNNTPPPTKTTIPPQHLLGRCTKCNAPIEPYLVRTYPYICPLCHTLPLLHKVSHVQNERKKRGEPLLVAEDILEYERRYAVRDGRRNYRMSSGGRSSSSGGSGRYRYGSGGGYVGKRGKGVVCTEYALPLFETRTKELWKKDQQRSISRRFGRTSGEERFTTQSLTYDVPADLCPPLWILLIDATSRHREYYARIKKAVWDALLVDDTVEMGETTNSTGTSPRKNDKDDKDNHNNTNSEDGGNDKEEEQALPQSPYRGTKAAIFLMTQNGGLSVLHFNQYHHRTTSDCSVLHTRVDPPPLEPYVPPYSSSVNVVQSAPPPERPPKAQIVPLVECLTFPDVFVSLDTKDGRRSIQRALERLEDDDNKGESDETVLRTVCRRRFCDGGNESGEHKHGSETKETDDVDTGGVWLGSTLQAVTDFLEDVGCCHPGNDTGSFPKEREENDEDGEINRRNGGFVPYAGGKIICFLAGPPVEIQQPTVPSPSPSPTPSLSPTPHSSYNNRFGPIGTGGFGGSCAPFGRRFEPLSQSSQQNRPTVSSVTDGDVDVETGEQGSVDVEAGTEGFVKEPNSANYGDERPLPPETYKGVNGYFNEIGTRCATAALGIEIFAFSSSSGMEREGVYFGLPVLRTLSDRSGGCGPLVVPISDGDDGGGWVGEGVVIGKERTNDMLVKELMARSPWYRPTAFGALLRIRLSPHLTMDTPTSSYNETPYCTAGLYGSLSVFPPNDDDNDGIGLYEEELYCMGTCDSHSTFCFEATVNPSSTGSYDDEYGEAVRQLSPCVQTSFAYTTVVEDNRKGGWRTVRRLRVATAMFREVNNTEELFKSADTDALTVNLFHRFYSLSLRDGLSIAQDAAREWTILTLLLLHRSAKRNIHILLNPHERIFSAADAEADPFRCDRIRLGAEHPVLCDLPLLIFSLFRCDALRLGLDSSPDARCAAAANLCTMSPCVLRRSVTPVLELWSNDGREQEPIFGGMMGTESDNDRVRSRMDELRTIVIDQFDVLRPMDDGEDYDVPRGGGGQPLLVVDSPRNIAVYDYHNICGMVPATTILSTALEESLGVKARSYRVTPPTYVGVGSETGTRWAAEACLKDALIEDEGDGRVDEGFERWCTALAKEISVLESTELGQ